MASVPSEANAALRCNICAAARWHLVLRCNVLHCGSARVGRRSQANLQANATQGPSAHLLPDYHIAMLGDTERNQVLFFFTFFY